MATHDHEHPEDQTPEYPNGKKKDPIEPEDDELIRDAEREAAEWESTVIVPPDAAASSEHDSSETWPSFPNYRIFRRLKAGGQGIIFLAVDERNEKLVAIKVLRDGVLASDRDRVRFEREALILSSLNCSGIVRIHEAGCVGKLDFLVTDFIRGKQVLKYSNDADLTIEQRVELFTKICQAMKVAHSLGIVHRDLKPANILVDSDGTPHIIDFGLAKSSALLHDETAQTITGDFVGSLPWASPEQAEGRVSHIDSKSDVYSLGVIFYQLLTGQFPYMVIGANSQVLDNICNYEPRRPSSLSFDVPKELDGIALKCLAKSREQRYPTAESLSDELISYLKGDSLPGGNLMLAPLIRTIRRHKQRVIAAAAVFVIVATSATVMTVAIKKSNAASRATQAMVEAVEGLSDLNPSSRAKQFDLLASRAKVELRDYPENLATVLHSIATAQFNVDQFESARLNYKEALELRRKVYAEPHEKIAESLAYLGSACQKMRDYREADRLYREALEMRRKLYAPNDRRIAQTLNNMATFKREQGELGDAIKLFGEALAIFEGSKDDQSELDIAKVLGSIGHAELDAGRCGAAQDHLAKSLKRKQALIHEQSPERELASVANTQFHLARFHMDCEPRHLDEAERLANLALEYRRQELPATHFHAESLLLMARIRQAQGRMGDALTYIRACVEIGSHIAGTHHEIVRDARRLAASIFENQGNSDLAREYQDPPVLLTKNQ